jgi:hypothetical protein
MKPTAAMTADGAQARSTLHRTRRRFQLPTLPTTSHELSFNDWMENLR